MTHISRKSGLTVQDEPIYRSANVEMLLKKFALNMNPGGPTITLSNVTGTFQVGETITGSDSEATATIIAIDGDSMTIDNEVNTFEINTDLITGGTSGATANISQIVYPDQQIVTDFPSFIITKIIFLNNSGDLSNVGNFQVWTEAERGGSMIAIDNGVFTSMNSVGKYGVVSLGGGIVNHGVPAGPSVYVSMKGQGVLRTCDMLIFGHELN